MYGGFEKRTNNFTKYCQNDINLSDLAVLFDIQYKFPQILKNLQKTDKIIKYS